MSFMFHFNAFAQDDNEIPELNRVVFMPQNAKVHVGGHIQLRLINIIKNDTSQLGSDKFENWQVNGKPDSEHLIVKDGAVIYSPGESKPTVNPVAVSCQFADSKPNDIRQTFICNIEVIDDKSGFMIDDNFYYVDPVMGLYSKSSGLTALTFVKGSTGVSISIQGNTPGIYNFSKKTAVGINMGSGYGTVTPDGNPSEGFIEIKEYGKTGEPIRVNVMGIVIDGNGKTHYLSGTFIIKHKLDTP